MDCPIWGTDDISDEELLKEFEAVKNMSCGREWMYGGYGDEIVFLSGEG